LGTSGSGARIHDRPSKLRAQQRTPSENGKRTLPSGELRRAPRSPERWPPGALRGKLVAGKSLHGQRRRSLRAWETVHKTAEIHSTASGANLSCRSFAPRPQLRVVWQGDVCHAPISMLSKVCQIVRTCLTSRFACPRCSAPNQQAADNSRRRGLLR
jgi:hypothetical protein